MKIILTEGIKDSSGSRILGKGVNPIFRQNLSLARIYIINPIFLQGFPNLLNDFSAWKLVFVDLQQSDTFTLCKKVEFLLSPFVDRKYAKSQLFVEESVCVSVCRCVCLWASYRPQRSCGKVIFSQVSVSHSVHGGVSASEQVPPGRYRPPPGRYHPRGRYSPGQVPPQAGTTPLGR